MKLPDEKIQIAILNVIKAGGTHQRHIVELVLKEHPEIMHPKDIRLEIRYLEGLGLIRQEGFGSTHRFHSAVRWKKITETIHEINKDLLMNLRQQGKIK